METGDQAREYIEWGTSLNFNFWQQFVTGRALDHSESLEDVYAGFPALRCVASQHGRLERF